MYAQSVMFSQAVMYLSMQQKADTFQTHIYYSDRRHS